MSDTPTIPPFVNRAMTFVLRSPFHEVVSNNNLLITFTGRKSGKAYTTPVSYSQSDGRLDIFTHANWWKNLTGGAPVKLLMKGREIQGLAEPVVEDKQSIAAGLMEHLRKVPGDAKYYRVTFNNRGDPSANEVEKAAQTVVMIRIQLC